MKYLFILISICFLGLESYAQDVKDKVNWEITQERTDQENEYRITAQATLQDGWHVFGQKPGDDFLIPTNFSFEGKQIKLLSMKELGKLKTETMEGIGTINYYEKKVSFVATVRSMDKDIKGYIEFQVCNASMCLPPTQENFSFTIK